MTTDGYLARVAAKAVRDALAKGACGGGHEETCLMRGVDGPCDVCMASLACENWVASTIRAEFAAKQALAVANVDA